MQQVFPAYRLHKSENRHLTDWEWPVQSLLLGDAALASVSSVSTLRRKRCPGVNLPEPPSMRTVHIMKL